MPLSEYEQRVLEQMERELTSDDPRLATTLKSTAPRSGTRYVIAGVGLVVGLLALVVGVAQSVPWVGVVGFVIMFSAVTYALAQPARRDAATGPIGTVSADGGIRRAQGRRGRSGSAPGRGASSSRGSFMQRLEERWEKRRRGE